MMNGEVLTLEEASELLRLGAGTVRRLAQRGELPGRKLGQQWRFSRQALLGCLAQPAFTPLPAVPNPVLEDPLRAALVVALGSPSSPPDPGRYQPLLEEEDVAEGTEEEEAAVWAALSEPAWLETHPSDQEGDDS